MNRELILQGAKEVFGESLGNTITKGEAISPELAGIDIFESPLVGFASAEDALFEKYKEEGVVGPWFKGPGEWIDGAKTVVSFFFPFTEEVKDSNRKMKDGPSSLWLHGRVEGQRFLNEYMKRLQEWLCENNINGVVPAIHSGFKAITAGNNLHEYDIVNETTFSSNWSERHAAYAAGLGTFGLSKGLITEKGIAGRFASIIIDAEVTPDERKYTGIYDYCTMCGACVRRCHGQAITMEEGKNHNKCNDFVNGVSKQHAPRYGCGLCQTKVPCESRIPKRV